jgi:PKD domain
VSIRRRLAVSAAAAVAVSAALAPSSALASSSASSDSRPATSTVSGGTPPLTLEMALSQVSALGVTAAVTPTDTADGATVATYSFDFGGAGAETVAGNGTATWVYTTPGTYDVSVTVTDSLDNTASVSGPVTTFGSDYTAYGPTRILDTRFGIGAPEAKVGPQDDVRVQIAGNGSIPADVTAVALNVTVTNPTAQGSLMAWADGGCTGMNGSAAATAPAIAESSYTTGQTIAALVVVPVCDGYVDLENLSNQGSTDLIADVTGYFTQAAAAGYTPVTPDRIMDTRLGVGVAKAPVPAGGKAVLTVTGADGGQLPAGTTAVALNVTVTNTAGSGFITAYADGSSTPNASNLNYVKGQTIANSIIVPVGADGRIDLYNGGGGAGSTDIIADVSGYFSAGSTSAYVPDAVILDDSATVAGGHYTSFGFTTTGGITSYLLDVTGGSTAGPGFFTVFPDAGAGSVSPNTSNLNWVQNGTALNLAFAQPGADGEVDFNDGGAAAAALQVQQTGYFQAG